MRPLVRTRRQARQRLSAALHALEDVIKAAPRVVRGQHLIPNGAVYHTASAISHTRAALRDLNHRKNHRPPDAGK